MAERDDFETRFGAAVHAYIGGISSDLDPAVLAQRIAAREPRRRGRIAGFGWRRVTIPRLAWVLLLLGALLAAVVGGTLIAGSRPSPELPVVVLPVDSTYTCPPGSMPDEPGPIDQARPATMPYWSPTAFDRRAGKLIVLVGAEVSPPSVETPVVVETWTFDVCTNTWTRMHPNREPPVQISGLVYDVDSDLTVGVHYEDWHPYPENGIGNVWTYDLEANAWTEHGLAPTNALSFYDPVTGLVIAEGDNGPWDYDVETDTWNQIGHPGEPAYADGPARFGISAYDASVDRVIEFIGLEQAGGTTRLVDLRTGAMSTSTAGTPVLAMGWWAVPPTIYDEAAQRTLVAANSRWGVYDATADRWEILFDTGCADECPGKPVAYDATNRRLIVVGGGLGVSGDIVAFDLVTREWTVLLEPVVPTWGVVR